MVLTFANGQCICSYCKQPVEVIKLSRRLFRGCKKCFPDYPDGTPMIESIEIENLTDPWKFGHASDGHRTIGSR